MRTFCAFRDDRDSQRFIASISQQLTFSGVFIKALRQKFPTHFRITAGFADSVDRLEQMSFAGTVFAYENIDAVRQIQFKIVEHGKIF